MRTLGISILTACAALTLPLHAQQSKACWSQTEPQILNYWWCDGATPQGWFRSYDPVARGWPAGMDLQVTAIRLGLAADSPCGSGGQPAEVRVYADVDGDPNPAPFDSLVLLASQPVVIPDSGGSLENFDLAQPVGFNNDGVSRLVVGLYIESACEAGADVRIAGTLNFDVESGSCYVISPNGACALADLTPIETMYDTGTIIDVCIEEAEVEPPEVFCTAKVNSCGTLPEIGFTGTPSVSTGAGFVITLDKGKSPFPGANPKAGAVLYSVSGSTPFPFDNGWICANNPLRTVNNPPVEPGTPGQCEARHALDFNAYVQGSLPGQTAPKPELSIIGQDVWAQWFARDKVATGPLLSDAIRFQMGP